MAKPTTESVRSYAVGLNKGFVVTRVKKIARPASRKSRTSNRVREIRKLVLSVTNLSAFEKRIVEMLKTGVQQVEKRAFKALRKKLGKRSRALKKREELLNMIRNSKK